MPEGKIGQPVTPASDDSALESPRTPGDPGGGILLVSPDGEMSKTVALNDAGELTVDGEAVGGGGLTPIYATLSVALPHTVAEDDTDVLAVLTLTDVGLYTFWASLKNSSDSDGTLASVPVAVPEPSDVESALPDLLGTSLTTQPTDPGMAFSSVGYDSQSAPLVAWIDAPTVVTVSVTATGGDAIVEAYTLAALRVA